MATLTLAQHAQLSKQPLKKGIMLGIAMQGVVADILPFRDTGGALAETGVRFDEVISPDWIPLDGTISSYTANGKPLSFSVYQMANHIDVPVNLENANANQLARTSVQQSKLAMKGAAYKLNDAFINGDPAADANVFEGINRLVAQMDSAQTIGATEIDLTGTYSDPLAESLFKRIDRGIHQTEGGTPSAAFTNENVLMDMESFARQYKLYGDHFNWGTYEYKIDDPRNTYRTASTRPSFVYRGIPFYDLGKKADQSTNVMLNSYSEGGSSAGSRIFFVKFGEEDVEGLEFAPLDVKDIGLLESKEVIRKRLTWTVGLAAWGPRSIVKVQGLKVNT